jgi:ABC-2 type transport system ATP-binding protein
MTDEPLRVETHDLRRTYGDRVALDGVSLSVRAGELFGLLGPNGGGKTTFFRVLTTTLPPTSGTVRVLGHELPAASARVREEIGVVFQAPSLDKMLTVRENLTHQGHLYGLRGADLAARIARNLEMVGLADRAGERTESLSGGLRRRAELAKGLLHDPKVLFLDEPSTGLDPGARRDLWDHLARLRDERGVTSLVTTHLMEEAERCDRVGILDGGRLVALGTPEELRASVGGDVVTVVPRSAADVADLRAAVESQLRRPAKSVGGAVRIETTDGAAVVGEVLRAFEPRVASVTVGRPTLEDVFMAKTGKRFASDEPPAAAPPSRGRAGK